MLTILLWSVFSSVLFEAPSGEASKSVIRGFQRRFALRLCNDIYGYRQRDEPGDKAASRQWLPCLGYGYGRGRQEDQHQSRL